MCESAERAILRSRSEARTGEQPATEAAIVVAIRSTCGTILLARFCNQAANLASCHSERTLMAVRLVARHGFNQEFEIIGQAGLCATRRPSRK